LSGQPRALQVRRNPCGCRANAVDNSAAATTVSSCSASTAVDPVAEDLSSTESSNSPWHATRCATETSSSTRSPGGGHLRRRQAVGTRPHWNARLRTDHGGPPLRLAPTPVKWIPPRRLLSRPRLLNRRDPGFNVRPRHKGRCSRPSPRPFRPREKSGRRAAAVDRTIRRTAPDTMGSSPWRRRVGSGRPSASASERQMRYPCSSKDSSGSNTAAMTRPGSPRLLMRTSAFARPSDNRRSVNSARQTRLPNVGKRPDRSCWTRSTSTSAMTQHIERTAPVGAGIANWRYK